MTTESSFSGQKLFQQLLCVLAGGGGLTTEHSGEFFDAGVDVEGGDVGFGAAVDDGFADDVMHLSNGGDGG